MNNSSSSKTEDKIFRSVAFAAAALSAAAVFLIILFLTWPALKALLEVPVAELWHTRWNPAGYTSQSWGIIPFVAGSLWVTLIALALAVPVALLASVFSTQFVPEKLRSMTDFIFGTLAGIPSVIMGFLALTVVGPLIAKVFGLNSGLTVLNGGIILSIMIMPTMVSTLADAFEKIDPIYAEGALALGATKWQAALTVLYRFVRPAFFASILLSFGRAIGETMAVIMAIGNVALIPRSPLQPGETLTGVLAIEMAETVVGSLHYNVLFLIGLLLLISTLIVNYLSELITQRTRVKVQ
ncbi:phosphate ABC transporter permease subunit PstC [Coprothermobacteraceae bacterium]|nr:phosphate ABC transporter permease subunit PstC [Coprothermobacteraceae bacterium]